MYTTQSAPNTGGETVITFAKTRIAPFPAHLAPHGYKLPCGMPAKTKPYKFQQEGIATLAENKYFGLFDKPGCIAGDSVIPFSRAGLGKKITIRMAYTHFNGLGRKNYNWDRSIPTYARALVNGELRQHRVLDIKYSGDKPVLLLVLRSGKSLRLTADHEVAMADGSWKRADLLREGDAVLTNGRIKCKHCGSIEKVTKGGKFRGNCRTCIYRYLRKNNWKTGKFYDGDGYVYVSGQWEHPCVKRSVKKGRSVVYEHILVAEKMLGRHLRKGEEVHHINGVKDDNRPCNLRVLTAREHLMAHNAYKRLSVDRWGNNTFAPIVDYVVSVTPAGVTDTYDMVMEDPHRNFVANGIVVHNCGKSLQLLYAAMNLMYLDRADCMVIVFRRSHENVWLQEQIPEHAPHLTVYSVVGMSPKERAKPWPRDRNIYAINYELLSISLAHKKDRGGPDVITLNNTVMKGHDIRNLYTLLRNKRCILVLDESHFIKSPTSNTTRVLHALAPFALYRYISTGTPAAERPEDVWSQIYFLDQGKLLGTDFKRFLSQYATFSESGDGKRKRRWIRKYKHLPKLQRVLSRVYLRRDNSDELPPKVVKPPVYLTPTTRQASVIADIRGVLVNALLKEARQGKATVSFGPESVFGGMLQKLNKASACPWVLQPQATDSAKANDLLEFVDEIGDDPLIVWCVNRSVSDAIAGYVHAKTGRDCVSVHGGVTGKERLNRLSSFKSGGATVLCATMDTLREAQTLVTARYAYYMQLNFSLLNWMQSQKRIHRIGQTKSVIIRTAFVFGTLDEYIFKKVVHKEGNSAIVTGDLRLDEEVPIEELLLALGYTSEKTRVSQGNRIRK